MLLADHAQDKQSLAGFILKMTRPGLSARLEGLPVETSAHFSRADLHSHDSCCISSTRCFAGKWLQSGIHWWSGDVMYTHQVNTVGWSWFRGASALLKAVPGHCFSCPEDCFYSHHHQSNDWLRRVNNVHTPDHSWVPQDDQLGF